MSFIWSNNIDHVMHTGLGNTVTDIDVSGAKVFSKTLFSMVIPEVEQELDKEADRKSVILFGIEVSKCKSKAYTWSYHSVLLLCESFPVTVLVFCWWHNNIVPQAFQVCSLKTSMHLENKTEWVSH